ncbi:MAG: glutathione peroxidase [Spirochaetia bacterium]|nr:glutathione peroxidase [Spirochaetia bacterium]
MIKDIYSFSANRIDGNEESLSKYKGKVLLIVNTASKCGFTPQYNGLQELYEKYKNQPFEILAFPCNQFGNQEPGNESEIVNFCASNFHVKFPLFSKIYVNGKNTHPLYKYLKKSAKGILGSNAIKWNFTKFLIDKHGRVIKRFASATKPEAIENDIVKLINVQGS